MSRHYLFTLWDGAGTVPPELSVARALIQRGHRVTVLGDPTIEAEARAAGADFRPWREAPHLKSRRPEDDFLRDYELTDPPALIGRLAERLICGPAAAYAADTTAAIRELAPDALVSSAFLLGPQIAGEAAALPVAAQLANIYPLPVDGRPPFGPGLPPAQTDDERRMHVEITEASRAMWNAHLAPVNAARAQLGLDPLAGVWEQLDHAERVLVLSSEAFDFPGPLPPNVRYVGPRLDDPAWAEDWQPPAGDDPVVLASLSTSNMEQLDLLRRIVAALGELPVRGVVTTGHAVDPAELPAADNVQVLRSASHQAVLEHAAALVTHGGHGTVIKALAADVPLLVLPMGRDQVDNATRVIVRGAGLQLAADASGDEIAHAVRRLLDEPAFRQAAAGLGATLRSEARTDDAVGELERLVPNDNREAVPA
jgi:UDP:flavonoid glycosyltransferase YjiC (YdhE family)